MRLLFTLLAASVLYAQPATQGLGASTYTCIDKDGDTYGVGPGCAGVDSDDKDSTIHTGAEIVSKYGTLAAALTHLGYTPTRIWYIATTGDNGTCASAGAPVGIGSPCADFAGVTLAAGDAVIYRAGTYTTSASRFDPSTDGTSTDPIIAMAYPGEVVLFDMTASSNSAVDLIDRNWIIVDGFQAKRGLNNGCIVGGDTSFTAGSNAFHDVTLRNIHVYECKWGFIAAGFDDILIEDSVMHDQTDNGGEHGIYIGAKGNRLATGATIRRFISYNNDRSGIHINGKVSGSLVEQTILYDNAITGLDLENGTFDSTFRSSIFFNNGSSSNIAMTNYDGSEGLTQCGALQDEVCVCDPTPNVGAGCAFNQTGNLFENLTLVQSNAHTMLDPSKTSSQHSVLIGLQTPGSCTTAFCLASEFTGNTFRNVIAVSVATDADHAPIVFQDTGIDDMQSTTFQNIVAYDAGASHRNLILTHLEIGVAWTTYTLAQAASAGITITNTSIVDPQFIAYDPTAYATPLSYDFRIGAASPALRTGSATAIPDYDLKGRAFTASPAPSIGAIERQLYTQGWNDLGASSGLRPAICPADGASGSVTNLGAAYPYQSTCASTIQSWSSAVARTKSGSEGLYLWGGGHSDGGNNSVYKLTVNTASPAMTRVTEPSQITAADYADCPSVLGDGNPNTRHTYGQLAYLPTQDSMFAFTGSLYCGNGLHDNKTWWLDLPGLTWTAKDPVNVAGYDPAANNSGYVSAGACAYDSVQDAVFCDNNGSVLGYQPATNRYSQKYFNGYGDGLNPSAVVDTKRRQWLQISNNKVLKVNIDNWFSTLSDVTDISGSVDSSCNGLVSAPGPGLVYNPVLDRIVGYPPNSGNVVYFMDPGDYTCTTQTISGGPPNNTFGATQPGTYGRFAYFPSLDVYAVVNGYNQPAYVLNLNDSDPTGVGSGGSRLGGKVTIGGKVQR
jgi:hypothetical protein